MDVSQKEKGVIETTTPSSPASQHDSEFGSKKPLRKRILGIIWDSLEKTPEERVLLAKLDWWILSYVCVAYFVSQTLEECYSLVLI